MQPNFQKIDPSQRLRILQAQAASRGLPLPPDIRARMFEEEAGKRGLLTYNRFQDFVQARHPDLLIHEYMLKQIDVAQRVLDGAIRRLMVFIPTQYGKSEIWSRLLPAYYLRKFPARRVVLSSFGADLAWELSSDARNNYSQSGGQFRDGSKKGAAKNWKTQRNSGATGGMFAVGIGGVMLGRGYNLGIVDDPMSPEQATRQAYLKRFQRWWPSQMLRGQASKKIGGNAIVFVMQRLDILDAARWLLDREQTSAAERWHILCLDEIHSLEPYGDWSDLKQYPEKKGFPVTCTVEPDFRKVGEVLAPKFKDPEEVASLQATAGPLVRAAQRQQRPMRPQGDFWKEVWFKDRTYDTLPSDAYNGGWDWDTAYTKDEKNSGTAGIKSFRGAGKKDEFNIYLEDMQLQYLEMPALVKLLRELKGPHHVEKKASGKSVVQTLKTYNIVATEVPVMGDKMARSAAAQPAVTTGRVWIKKLLYEQLMSGDQGLLRITADALQMDGEGLDVNDAFVQAIFRHLGIGSGKKEAIFG